MRPHIMWTWLCLGLIPSLKSLLAVAQTCSYLRIFAPAMPSVWNSLPLIICLSFSGGSVVKNPPANARDLGDLNLIPGSGRSPGGGNGNPLQYSCLENPVDTGAWHAAVCGGSKSWTPLSDWAPMQCYTTWEVLTHSEYPSQALKIICTSLVMLIALMFGFHKS